MIGFRAGEMKEVGERFEAIGFGDPRQFLRQGSDKKTGVASRFPHAPPFFVFGSCQLPLQSFAAE